VKHELWQDKHHSAWSEHTSCPVGVQMVTSYVSLQHLTHTGPFHTSLNHSSGQLLTINTLPVYCHTFVLAILSCSAWPVKMKALCSFEISGTNAPVTQHHNPEDSNRDCCGERLRSCERQIDSNADNFFIITNLIHKFLVHSHKLHRNKFFYMFRAQSAHHQEVDDANCTCAASGIITLCKWPSCATAKEVVP